MAEEWELISGALQTVISSVEGVGTILDYEPNILRFSALKPYLQAVGAPGDPDRLNIWYVLRSSTGSQHGGIGTRTPLGFAMTRDTFRINGYYNYTERESTIAVYNLSDRLRRALTAAISLGHPERGWVVENPGTISLSMAMFFDILCHNLSVDVTVVHRGDAGYY
jgi:hypothetical protein